MRQVNVRGYSINDITSLVELEQQWEQERNAYDDFRPLGRAGFLATLERFSAYFLVAELDDEIVGYIRGSLHSIAPVPVLQSEGTCVEVEDLYVRPDVRDETIGQTLLERLLTVARHAGVRRFVVSTLSTHTDQILRFYRRHGFTPWHIQIFLQDDKHS